MPFDTRAPSAEYAVPVIRLAVRDARERGVLACDHTDKLTTSELVQECDGVTYVCAVGAWRRAGAGIDDLATLDFAWRLQAAHDNLFCVRKAMSDLPELDQAKKDCERDLAELLKN